MQLNPCDSSSNLLLVWHNENLESENLDFENPEFENSELNIENVFEIFASSVTTFVLVI